MSVLDEDVAARICEDALDERVVTQRLRKMVRTTLSEIEPDKTNWHYFLCEVFGHYVPEFRHGVCPKQFTLFLHGIQIHLSKKSIKRIFKVIDFDQSGYISWNEFSRIVFPELFGGYKLDKKIEKTSNIDDFYSMKTKSIKYENQNKVDSGKSNDIKKIENNYNSNNYNGTYSENKNDSEKNNKNVNGNINVNDGQKDNNVDKNNNSFQGQNIEKEINTDIIPLSIQINDTFKYKSNIIDTKIIHKNIDKIVEKNVLVDIVHQNETVQNSSNDSKEISKNAVNNDQKLVLDLEFARSRVPLNDFVRDRIVSFSDEKEYSKEYTKENVTLFPLSILLKLPFPFLFILTPFPPISSPSFPSTSPPPPP